MVHLTNPGRRIIRDLFAEHERDMERAVAGLMIGERATLAETLRKLGRSAEELLEKQQPTAVGDKTRRSKKEGR